MENFFFLPMIVLGHVIWESLRLLTVQCRSAIDLRGPDYTQCWLWSSPNNGNVVNRARSLLSSRKKKRKKHNTGQWSLQYDAMLQLDYYQLKIKNLSIPLTQSNGVYTFLFFPSHVTTQTRNSIWRMVWRIWLSDVGLRGCGPPSFGLKTVSKLLKRMHHFHPRSSTSYEKQNLKCTYYA